MSLTWEDVDEYPRILERGPIPKGKQQQQNIPPYMTVVDGDMQWVIAGATDAYEAMAKMTSLPPASKVVVVLGDEYFIIGGDVITPDSALRKALEVKSASEAKPKRKPRRKQDASG